MGGRLGSRLSENLRRGLLEAGNIVLGDRVPIRRCLCVLTATRVYSACIEETARVEADWIEWSRGEHVLAALVRLTRWVGRGVRIGSHGVGHWKYGRNGCDESSQ